MNGAARLLLPRRAAWVLFVALLVGCATSEPASRPTSQSTSRPTSQPSSSSDDDLARVASIHGGLGPWAVAGMRIGQRALRELARARGDMRVLVEHRSPAEVQWSCVADGIQAATGASPGKLTLRWTESPETTSVVRDQETGVALTFTLTAAFRERYLNVPREGLDAAGREVATLDDDAIFTLVSD